jgi:two-component system, chemotaxis family, chemotaxis protein CheY
VEGKVEKKYSVMVIEDDPASRILICELLEAMGIDEVVEAGDGKDALLKLYWNEVDLVISDWRMPEMNGLEFYKQAKEEELIENTAFLMVSAENEKVKVIEAANEGIRDYVVKPIDLMIMQNKIKSLLKMPD